MGSLEAGSLFEPAKSMLLFAGRNPEAVSFPGATRGKLLGCGTEGCIFGVVETPHAVIKVTTGSAEGRLAQQLLGDRRADFLPLFHQAKVLTGNPAGLHPGQDVSVILREDLSDFPMPGEDSAYPDAIMDLVDTGADPRLVIVDFEPLTNLEVQGVLAIGNLFLWGIERGIYFNPAEFWWEDDDDWRPGDGEKLLPNAVANLGVTAQGRVVARDLGRYTTDED